MIFYYEVEETNIDGTKNTYCGYASGYCLDEINTDIINKLDNNGISNITKFRVDVISDYSISVSKKEEKNNIYKSVNQVLSDNYRKEDR